MLNEERFCRTIALLGKEKAEVVCRSSVMVVGCGAVGGYALEMIARLGFGKIWTVDFDVFEESNINRQILAVSETLGRKKCEVAKERVCAINPEAEVIALDKRLSADNLEFIAQCAPDFVIDAIDDMRAKAALISFLHKNDISFVSSMGAALKMKPELLRATTLDKTFGCPMAKKLRGMLRKNGVNLSKVRCVFSSEEVSALKDERGQNILGSLPMVPAAMGTMLASEVLKECLKKV